MSGTLQQDIEGLSGAVDGAVKLIKQYDEATAELLASADDTGCDGDLTVVSKSAVEHLQLIFKRRI